MADVAPTVDASTVLSSVEAFDSVGPAYEDAFKGLATQAAAVQWLVDQMPKAGGGRFVDVGCGTGRPVCSALADAGHDVLGIDISPAMLAAARERVPNATFEQLDVRAYLAREAAKAAAAPSLDGVGVFFSLIAGVSQAEIREILAGLAALMKPGAALVWATVPLPVENESIKWMGRPLVVSSLSPAEAVAAVQAAGLEVVHQAESSYLPKAVEIGLCKADEVWEEPHLFVYAKKPLA